MDSIPILTQTRVTPLTRIRRERVLPVPGQVTATIGSRVDPLDSIGQTAGEGHLRPVPLARYMHLAESALPNYLLKRPGDEVAAREIIASRPELFGTLQRIYRAPAAGRVVALQGDWMTIELARVPMQVKALYRGVIVNVMPRLGAVIEAFGSLVQGVWGDGGEGYGVLKKIVDAPDALIAEDKIDVTARGAILLGGAGVSEQALRRAVQERAAGLVVGGMAPELQELVATLGLPTLVTEGFGEHAMAAPIFDLLAAHDGEECCLNSATRVRGGTARPEVFVPAISPAGAAADSLPSPILTAQPGATVRITFGARKGGVGKITEIPKMPQALESGVSAWGAEIDLGGGERVFVPWQNLELIG